MKLFNIYSNGHGSELCPESGGEISTSVFDAETMNPIRLGGGGRSSKNPWSSVIMILNSTNTSIPPGGNRCSSYLNSIDIDSVLNDPCPASK